jgi:hypothetical protein
MIWRLLQARMRLSGYWADICFNLFLFFFDLNNLNKNN